MAWMREVPVVTNNFAVAILVVSMITHRLHFLLATCLANILAGDVPVDTYTREYVAFIFEVIDFALRFGAKSVTVTVMAI